MLTSGDRRTAHFRAHERRRVQLEALVWRAPGLARAEPETARVKDLGLGGARIACAAGLGLDDRLTLTLLSPTLLDPLVAPARVAWVRVAEDAPLVEAGLAFEILERGALLTLFQLIGALTM